MSREQRWATAALVALGAFVFFMLVVGSLGGVKPEIDPIHVADLLSDPMAPAERYGDTEVRVVGWYAELRGDCVEHGADVDPSVAWLTRGCPLRVLMPQQPVDDVSQAELERGLRLSAPLGNVFPSRPGPGGANLQMQQLVFIGHFADPAAAACAPELRARCRNTLVPTDYDGFFR